MNSNNWIEPITAEQQRQVLERTRHFIGQASVELDCNLPDIPVQFDLIGRAAGMYKAARGSRVIRYNPYLFARYFDDSLNVTVPHEVAHYTVDVLHGRRVRPHGAEWKAVMALFGVDNVRATARFDLQGIPQRRQRRFNYRCGCGPTQLGSRRHHNIQRGLARYVCRRCGSELEQSPLGHV